MIACGDAIRFCLGLERHSVNAIITDMPYGLTNCEWDSAVDLPAWWAAVEHCLMPSGIFITTSQQPFTSVLTVSKLEWFRREIIWSKRRVTGFLDKEHYPLKAHENILVFSPQPTPPYYPQMSWGAPKVSRKRGRGATEVYAAYEATPYENLEGSRYPTTIIEVSVGANERGLHPTQKPVALLEYLLMLFTKRDDLVVDPFMGSGTTLVAARNLGRRYLGCDQSEEYVAVVQQRLDAPILQPSLLPR